MIAVIHTGGTCKRETWKSWKIQGIHMFKEYDCVMVKNIYPPKKKREWFVQLLRAGTVIFFDDRYLIEITENKNTVDITAVRGKELELFAWKFSLEIKVCNKRCGAWGKSEKSANFSGKEKRTFAGDMPAKARKWRREEDLNLRSL